MQLTPHEIRRAQHSRRGFGLIELLIAMAIVGILAALAYPAYTGFVQRARRAEAQSLLTQVMQAQERYRANRSRYASALASLDAGLASQAAASPHYTVSLAGIGGDFAAGYEVTATVKANSPQAGDKACWKLSARLERAQLRYLAETHTGTASSSCWAR